MHVYKCILSVSLFLSIFCGCVCPVLYIHIVKETWSKISVMPQKSIFMGTLLPLPPSQEEPTSSHLKSEGTTDNKLKGFSGHFLYATVMDVLFSLLDGVFYFTDESWPYLLTLIENKEWQHSLFTKIHLLLALIVLVLALCTFEHPHLSVHWPISEMSPSPYAFSEHSVLQILPNKNCCRNILGARWPFLSGKVLLCWQNCGQDRLSHRVTLLLKPVIITQIAFKRFKL